VGRSDSTGIVDLLHEVGLLGRLQRSGAMFLGCEKQTVAEHSFRTAVIGSLLADRADQPVDRLKVLQICLFHDFGEARYGDLNGVQKRYLTVDRDRYHRDLSSDSVAHAQVSQLIGEYEQQSSLEAQLAFDADHLELICFLKSQVERGFARAQEWIDEAVRSLKTEVARAIATEIAESRSDAWWQKVNPPNFSRRPHKCCY
jgi:5'-deoxynucleotidase YfbR-like HD superfamily hydrolase